MNRDRACLSWWYPRVKDAPGIRTPATRVITLSDKEGWSLVDLLDGKMPPIFPKLVADIQAAGSILGWPLFLRTGQGSGKHDWRNTCYVPTRTTVGQHVRNLVEWSGIVDMLGLPHNVWVARKMLPVQPYFHCRRYGGMPVVREWRLFVRDGGIECAHPYWPEKALEQGDPDDPNWRSRLPELHALAPYHARKMAELGGAACGGYWSVDILDSEDGYYLTDMAPGEMSWHDESCSHSTAEKPRRSSWVKYENLLCKKVTT